MSRNGQENVARYHETRINYPRITSCACAVSPVRGARLSPDSYSFFRAFYLAENSHITRAKSGS